VTSGEICAVTQVPAGYGKVAILDVNSGNGFTIAVSEAKHITRIARRTVISDNALSVLVPILEDVVGWEAARIRQLFASKGLALQQWDKARTDWVTLRLRRRHEMSVTIIGWLATAVFASSYFFRRPLTLRRIQAGAALLWVMYGIAIGALYSSVRAASDRGQLIAVAWCRRGDSNPHTLAGT
jgi:hypothetical protein